MRLWPGRGRSEAAALADRVAVLAEQVDRLARRVDDAEDTLELALAPDRVDVLIERVDELAMGTATHDELLEVRLHSARVASQLTKTATELRAEIERAATGALSELAQRQRRLESLAEVLVDLSEADDDHAGGATEDDGTEDGWAETG